MGIELPKYTIQKEPKNSVILKSNWLFLFALALFILGFLFKGFLNSNRLSILQQRNTVLESINTTNQDKLNSQGTELSLLITEKKIKQEALIQAQLDYKSLLEAQELLSSDLKFYDRLLSSGSQYKSLRVFETKIQHKEFDTYAINIVLIQKIERANETTGTYKVSVIGKQGDKTKTIKLSNGNKSQYKFKYFQKISLEFLAPKGFKAQQLIVELLPHNKKAKTVEFKTAWHTNEK